MEKRNRFIHKVNRIEDIEQLEQELKDQIGTKIPTIVSLKICRYGWLIEE